MDRHLSATGSVDLVKLEPLLVGPLADHHLLVVSCLQAAAGSRRFPAAAEHSDVPLQLQQLVVQALPLHRFLPVEGSQAFNFPDGLLLHLGQLPQSVLQRLQLVLHVSQHLANRGAKLLAGDVQITGRSAHLAKVVWIHGEGSGRRGGRRPVAQQGADPLSRHMVVGLQLRHLLVQLLDDIIEVADLPPQVDVPLEEIVPLLLLGLELLPQILDDLVPLQESSAGSKSDVWSVSCLRKLSV